MGSSSFKLHIYQLSRSNTEREERELTGNVWKPKWLQFDMTSHVQVTFNLSPRLTPLQHYCNSSVTWHVWTSHVIYLNESPVITQISEAPKGWGGSPDEACKQHIITHFSSYISWRVKRVRERERERESRRIAAAAVPTCLELSATSLVSSSSVCVQLVTTLYGTWEMATIDLTLIALI